ncbi:MAG: hypothetical protein JWR37_1300 [Mycobacterium sp.]|nr:hypothetical protein [Mycobacterium sp.]
MPAFASYDGTQLWYDCLGEGPPLVCLAGGPGADGRSLGDLGGLTSARTLVRLDARAAGRSAVPTDRATCAFTEQAHDIDELRRFLGLDRVDVLAHSAGALTAQEFAARFTDRLRRLVLVAPAGRVAREVDEVEVAEIRGAQTRQPWHAALEDEVHRTAAHWYGGWSPAVQQHFELDESLPEPPSWLRAAFYVGAADGRPARLAAVPTPVLVLAGESDGVAGTGPAERVAAVYPEGRLATLPDCGHWPWVNHPELFRALVEEFLAAGTHSSE